MGISDLPPHILAPQTHLNRAGGYFELEMFQEADRELRALPDEQPWLKKKKFSGGDQAGSQRTGQICVQYRESFVFFYPDEEDWWVSDAFATRRSESIEEARKILLEGLAAHYDSAIFRYNLACYAVCLGTQVSVWIF